MYCTHTQHCTLPHSPHHSRFVTRCLTHSLTRWITRWITPSRSGICGRLRVCLFERAPRSFRAATGNIWTDNHSRISLVSSCSPAAGAALPVAAFLSLLSLVFSLSPSLSYCDEIKGTQDQDFSCSFSDSLSCTCTITPSLFTITCTCCYDEIKGTQNQDLFSCSFSDSLSLFSPSRLLCLCLSHSPFLFLSLVFARSLSLAVSLRVNKLLLLLQRLAAIEEDSTDALLCSMRWGGGDAMLEVCFSSFQQKNVETGENALMSQPSNTLELPQKH